MIIARKGKGLEDGHQVTQVAERHFSEDVSHLDGPRQLDADRRRSKQSVHFTRDVRITNQQERSAIPLEGGQACCKHSQLNGHVNLHNLVIQHLGVDLEISTGDGAELALSTITSFDHHILRIHDQLHGSSGFFIHFHLLHHIHQHLLPVLTVCKQSRSNKQRLVRGRENLVQHEDLIHRDFSLLDVLAKSLAHIRLHQLSSPLR